ncbi:MAG: type II toxin-antitoxin system RelE/ParE family toxin [Oceanicaulis sp.]|nr:type II toxin-antitoxin system RelE/ParE family toxin [Oceanicaulis sp.]
MSDPEQIPKIPLVFYRTAAGNEPVRDWLKEMNRDDRLAIGADLQRVQYRWPVGMPLCRAMKDGLWEVRTHLPSRTISRVLLCFHEGVIVALHGFIKKTRTTPDEDMALARQRKKEVEHG